MTLEDGARNTTLQIQSPRMPAFGDARFQVRGMSVAGCTPPVVTVTRARSNNVGARASEAINAGLAYPGDNAATATATRHGANRPDPAGQARPLVWSGNGTARRMLQNGTAKQRAISKPINEPLPEILCEPRRGRDKLNMARRGGAARRIDWRKQPSRRSNKEL